MYVEMFSSYVSRSYNFFESMLCKGLKKSWRVHRLINIYLHADAEQDLLCPSKSDTQESSNATESHEDAMQIDLAIC